MTREKKITGLMADIEVEAEGIMQKFSQFTHGTRVLLLLHRHATINKEHNRRKARWVTHDEKHLKGALKQMLVLKAHNEDSQDLRVYMSASPRDIHKAEMEFKTAMLASDFTGNEGKQFFWEHLDDKWISALMTANPPKGETLFVLDIDTPDDSEALKAVSRANITQVFKYKTKNGWHIVTLPFQESLFPKELGGVKKDGLLLLSY